MVSKVLTSNNFTISTEIKTHTFNRRRFLDNVTRDLSSLDANLFELDQATYLRDVFCISYQKFDEIANRIKRGDLSKHIEFQRWLKHCYYYPIIRGTSSLHPYCPILNSHPLEIKNASLYVKKDLLEACTSERKRDLSSSYGEGIGSLLLRNYRNVNAFGVLKIHTGKGSTPDFILVNKYKKIVLLSEIKSTINYQARNPTNQLCSYKDQMDCLGIQVIFNKGERPIEIVLLDPPYKMEGNIFPAIYANLSLYNVIESINNNKNNQSFLSEDNLLMSTFIEILREYDLGHFDLTKIVTDENKIETRINILDKFLSDYFNHNGTPFLKQKE